MARVKISPVKPLELEFADGIIKKALFNNEAFILYTEEFGDIEKDMKDMKATENPFELMGKILYCGMKVVHPSTTLDEAMGIIYAGGQGLIIEISNLIYENFNVSSNEETKKKLMGMLTPEQKSAMKQMGWED